MYIRKTEKKYKNKKYYQYQLVKSVRTSKGPRQKILLNLGNKLDIDDSRLKDLADLIDKRVNERFCFDLFDDNLKRYAEHFANLLIEKRLKEKGKEIKKDDKKQKEEVFVNSTENKRFKPIGVEHAVLSEIKKYELFKKLKKIGFGKVQAKKAAAAIISKAVHPASERETARWLKYTSGLDDLLKTNFSGISDNSLHRVVDKLWENKDEIENHLTSKAKQLYNLDDKIILYDLTNTFFETSKKDSELAKYGNSKEKRYNSPLVSLALVTDKNGFIKKSKIYKGNVSEYDTLKEIISDLRSSTKKLQLINPTVVLDAGIASKKNLKLLESKNFKYVVVSKQKSLINSLNWDKKYSEIEMENERKLYVKSHKTDGETYLLCKSKRKLKKEESIYKKRIQKFKEKIKHLDDGLHKRYRLKNYEKVLEKIGRLKEKYKVGALFDIKVKKDPNSNNAKKISLEKNDKKLTDLFKKTGKYLLRTNRKDLSMKEISETHRSLTQVEKTFRCLKTDLKIRPKEFQNDKRIKAHIFLTVLAYQIISGILHQIREDDYLPHSWKSIKNILATHLRGITSFYTVDGYRIDLKNSTKVTKQQKRIYNTLNIRLQPKSNKILKTKLRK